MTRNVMIYILYLIFFGLSDQDERDGRSMRFYGGHERCIQGFGGETCGKEITSKT
jgi:hypothetical protein